MREGQSDLAYALRPRTRPTGAQAHMRVQALALRCGRTQGCAGAGAGRRVGAHAGDAGTGTHTHTHTGTHGHTRRERVEGRAWGRRWCDGALWADLVRSRRIVAWRCRWLVLGGAAGGAICTTLRCCTTFRWCWVALPVVGKAPKDQQDQGLTKRSI